MGPSEIRTSLDVPCADLSQSDVVAFYARYSAVLSDNLIAEWSALFTEDCHYDVISRSNYERGLPLATMRYRSRGALNDRVAALESTLVYAPRAVSHLVGGAVATAITPSGASARSSIAVYQTFADGDTHLLVAGRTFDDLVLREDGTLLFAKRTVVYDSERIPGAMVYPL